MTSCFHLFHLSLQRLAATFFPLRRTKFLVQTLYSRVDFAAVAPRRLRTGRNPQYIKAGVGGEVSGRQEVGRPPELARVLNGRAARGPPRPPRGRETGPARPP